MNKFIKELRNKKIHLIGPSGAEGSSILRFLVKYGINDITVHDFIENDSLEKNFRIWHKNLDIKERGKLYNQFTADLEKTVFYDKKNYLKDIEKADIIFVPQSWRLYPQNRKLMKLTGIPFYSLTRLYLMSHARVIGVTGTVGKGSVCFILQQLLSQKFKNVYFAGNDTWRPQLADILPDMKSSDILILEISHRQLLDGIDKTPSVVIFTNLYPNHLDEMAWEEYVNIKLSLLYKMKKNDRAVLNYDCEILRKIKLITNIYYYSPKNILMNTKNIQIIYPEIMNIKNTHYVDNVISACTAANLLGLDAEDIIKSLPTLQSLPARMQMIADKNNIRFFDDLKSTTPWSTLKAADKLSPNLHLILGGDTKGIDYREFFRKLPKIKGLIILESQLCQLVRKEFPEINFVKVSSLRDAVEKAYDSAVSGDNILVSPAAAFFYTQFIKGKESIKKIITSLPPKEQARGESFQ